MQGLDLMRARRPTPCNGDHLRWRPEIAGGSQGRQGWCSGEGDRGGLWKRIAGKERHILCCGRGLAVGAWGAVVVGGCPMVAGCWAGGCGQRVGVGGGGVGCRDGRGVGLWSSWEIGGSRGKWVVVA